MGTQTRRAVQPASILLVDDHPVFRQGLKDILRRECDLTVCGEAENPEEALALIASTKPDLVIVDLKLKDSDGLDLVKELARNHPTTLTLVLSMRDEALHAERSIRAGACGYVSKQERPSRILEAVRKVLGGEIYWSERAATQVASRITRSVREAKDAPAECLSARERQVFELIGGGSSTAQIAASLHISVSTVEVYRARIKEKLHLKDATELLQRAIRWNVTNAAS